MQSGQASTTVRWKRLDLDHVDEICNEVDDVVDKYRNLLAFQGPDASPTIKLRQSIEVRILQLERFRDKNKDDTRANILEMQRVKLARALEGILPETRRTSYEQITKSSYPSPSKYTSPAPVGGIALGSNVTGSGGDFYEKETIQTTTKTVTTRTTTTETIVGPPGAVLAGDAGNMSVSSDAGRGDKVDESSLTPHQRRIHDTQRQLQDQLRLLEDQKRKLADQQVERLSLESQRLFPGVPGKPGDVAAPLSYMSAEDQEKWRRLREKDEAAVQANLREFQARQRAEESTDAQPAVSRSASAHNPLPSGAHVRSTEDMHARFAGADRGAAPERGGGGAGMSHGHGHHRSIPVVADSYAEPSMDTEPGAARPPGMHAAAMMGHQSEHVRVQQQLLKEQQEMLAKLRRQQQEMQEQLSREESAQPSLALHDREHPLSPPPGATGGYAWSLSHQEPPQGINGTLSSLRQRGRMLVKEYLVTLTPQQKKELDERRRLLTTDKTRAVGTTPLCVFPFKKMKSGHPSYTSDPKKKAINKLDSYESMYLNSQGPYVESSWLNQYMRKTDKRKWMASDRFQNVVNMKAQVESPEQHGRLPLYVNGTPL